MSDVDINIMSKLLQYVVCSISEKPFMGSELGAKQSCGNPFN